ncbi:MAG: hypothetical protein ACRD8A_15455 [Candidatus Acidiferrales bacterium]
MAGHHNKRVQVFGRVQGLSPLEIFKTTVTKANTLISSKVAVLRDPARGVLGGIEIIANPEQMRGYDPARVESSAAQAAALGNGTRAVAESPAELARYFRTRSPYRWARRLHITPRRKKDLGI